MPILLLRRVLSIECYKPVPRRFVCRNPRHHSALHPGLSGHRPHWHAAAGPNRPLDGWPAGLRSSQRRWPRGRVSQRSNSSDPNRRVAQTARAHEKTAQNSRTQRRRSLNTWIDPMAQLISNPTVVQAAGNKPKVIEEFIGRVNSGTSPVSIARMKSPPGWIEPGQTPEFDEYTVVLRGLLASHDQGRNHRRTRWPGRNLASRPMDAIQHA